MIMSALGSVQLGLGNGAEAEEAYRLAIPLARAAALPAIYLGLGEAHRLQEKSEDAIRAYRLAVQQESITATIRMLVAERIEALSARP